MGRRTNLVDLKPSILMFTCMDSRMLPTRITQAHVGEIFVVRNAGNIIPHVQTYGETGSDISVSTEPAAMELAVKRGGIRHIVCLGHADCKVRNGRGSIQMRRIQAMGVLYNLHQSPDSFDITSPMDHWMRSQGIRSIKRLNEALQSVAKAPVKFRSRVHPHFNFDAFIDPLNKLAVQDKLSQVNVLQQLVNLSKHSVLWPYIKAGELFAHAMWFDVYSGELFLFSRKRKMFVKVDVSTSTGFFHPFVCFQELSVPILLEEMDEFEKTAPTAESPEKAG